MCSTSNVNIALQGVSNTAPSVSAPSIASHKVRQHRASYFLVDVREDAEIQEKPMPEGVVDASMTMGTICHDASDLLALAADKTIVLVCNTGRRAELAAQNILTQTSSTNVKVAVLQRGMVGWDNMAALSPDFLVVLGLGGDATEKLSLSLAALAAAVDSHNTVVLVLMSDGVNWFLTPDSSHKASETPNVESVAHGAPFKPCKAMLNKFLTKGGVVLACTTCVKHRGYSFDADMMDCINPMQMPDLVRMLGEAKGGCLQFM